MHLLLTSRVQGLPRSDAVPHYRFVDKLPLVCNSPYNMLLSAYMQGLPGSDAVPHYRFVDERPGGWVAAARALNQQLAQHGKKQVRFLSSKCHQHVGQPGSGLNHQLGKKQVRWWKTIKMLGPDVQANLKGLGQQQSSMQGCPAQTPLYAFLVCAAKGAGGCQEAGQRVPLRCSTVFDKPPQMFLCILPQVPVDAKKLMSEAAAAAAGQPKKRGPRPTRKEAEENAVRRVSHAFPFTAGFSIACC